MVAPLYAIANICQTVLMSLPAMTLGDQFCVSKVDGQGEVGRYTQRVKTAWLYLGSAVNLPHLGH